MVRTIITVADNIIGSIYMEGPLEIHSEEKAIEWFSKHATDYRTQEKLKKLADASNERAKYVMEHAMEIEIEDMMKDS